MKSCSKCFVSKEYKDFHKRKNSIDGYRSDCKSCRLSHYKTLYKNNQVYRDNKIKYSSIYYNDNKKRALDKAKIYRKDNKEKIKEKKRIYFNKKLKEDIHFKLRKNLRMRLYFALKNNSKNRFSSQRSWMFN